MDIGTDDTYWVMDLENALLEDCSATDIYCISKGRQLPDSLRADVWQICLDVRDRGNQLEHFSLVYDLPNQRTLHRDCSDIIAKLDNDDHDKISLVSEIETIITCYCKTRNIDYNPDDQLLELIFPLLTINVSKPVLYNLFDSVRDTYIDDYHNSNIYHILRLLLLYHDPELCTLLDSKKIAPQAYCASWFKTLFAAGCHVNVVIPMWDYYFQQSDPFFIYFLALIMIVNAKESLVVASKDESTEKMVEMLAQMPSVLCADDVGDFCSLAQYYALKTPVSFKNDLLERLCKGMNPSDKTVAQALCLPVSVQELLEPSYAPEGVRFFLVDCRPIQAYNRGHLANAFHLDCELLLQEPASFQLAVQGLLAAQKQAVAIGSGGKHLCFLGHGGDALDRDSNTHMVVAYFLQKNMRYVSILNGGYFAVHRYLEGENMNVHLHDHNESECEICLRRSSISTLKSPTGSTKSSGIPTSNSSSSDLIGKFSAMMKSKSVVVKNRLVDYIVNPGAMSQSTSNDKLSAQAEADRQMKRQRNVAPVFSIDDDHESVGYGNPTDGGDGEKRALVDLVARLNATDVLHHFPCHVVNMNGYMSESHLLVTDSHLIVLRETSTPKKAEIVVNRLLASIVKITVRKRQPNLITIKYGKPENEALIISDMDRFLIPSAEIATRAISDQILVKLKAEPVGVLS